MPRTGLIQNGNTFLAEPQTAAAKVRLFKERFRGRTDVFAQPVPACHARRVASFFSTETMSRRHELGSQSYDRLFPSQDTLPKGGFGNLIALPFQRAGERSATAT